jgi:hypothetical protein
MTEGTKITVMSERIEIVELAAGLTFHAWHTRGDGSIRTHTLSS